MTDEIAWFYRILALATWIGVPLYAAVVRGRFYATFSAVILSFTLPSTLILHDRLRGLSSADVTLALDCFFAYSMTVTCVQFSHLVHARMRGSFFRWLVSVPAQTFIAGGMLATPWLVVLFPFRLLFDALDWEWTLQLLTLVEALPFAIAALSIVTSMTTRLETVRFRLSRQGPDEIQRVPVERRQRCHGRIGDEKQGRGRRALREGHGTAAHR